MRNLLPALLMFSIFNLAGAGGARAQSLYYPPLTGSAWDTTTPASLGYQAARIDSLYGYLSRTHTKAFLLLKDGRIVLERYFGSFVPDSLHVWNSAGKTLTAFTTGIAQQEGHLRLTDSISTIIGPGWTSCTPAQEERITVRHLLTMTSGLDDTQDPYCTLPSCFTYRTAPGTRWAYYTAAYTMLDTTLQTATGQTLNNYLTTRIKAPTGITGRYITSDYNHVFVSTARSMARFGLLLQGHGTWNGTGVLTDTAYFRQMTNASQTLNPAYGFLTWLNGSASYMIPRSQLVIPGPWGPNAPADLYAALGKDGQICSVAPSQGLVMVRMGDSPSPTRLEVTTQYCDTIWQYLNRLATPTHSQVSQASNPILQPLGASRYRLVDRPQTSGTIRDMLGRRIADFQAGLVDLSAFPSGLYWLEEEDGPMVRLIKDE